MSTGKTAPKNIDEYIARFPKDVQGILKKIRMTLRKAAPGAEESIGYQIPTFKLKGTALYFAAFKAHIGLYPVTTAIKEKFKQELSAYEQSTGTVRFPLDKPVPYTLIGRIAKFMVKEHVGIKNKKKRRKR